MSFSLVPNISNMLYNIGNYIERAGLRGPLIFSCIFHMCVVIFMIVGLPYIKPELPPIEQSIAVELVDIAEVRQSNNIDISPPVKPTPREDNTPPEPPAKKSPKTKSPPKVTSTTPPKPIAPKRPNFKPAESPETTKEEPVKKPFLLPEQETQDEEAFNSLLRNLTPEEDESQQDGELETKNNTKSPLNARFGPKMTMTELDALKMQLGRCWNLMAGARFAEDLVVDLRLYMNPDGNVRKAEVVNQIRNNTDPYFRAAADSAMRAIRNPSCMPLQLPADKYDLWKVMVVTFDPREMLQ